MNFRFVKMRRKYSAVTEFKTFTTTNLKIDAGREYGLNPILKFGEIKETAAAQTGADITNSSNAELSDENE